MVTVHTCSMLSLSNMYSEGHKHATDVKLDSTVCSRQDTKSGKWKTRKAGTETETETETEAEIRKRSSDLKVSIVRVDGNSMQVCWYGDG